MSKKWQRSELIYGKNGKKISKPVRVIGWEESVSKPKPEYWQKLNKGDVKK